VIAVAAAIVVLALPDAIRFATGRARSGFWALVVAALVVDVPLFGLSRTEDPRPRSTLSVCFTFAIFVLWDVAPAVVVQAAAGAVTMIGQHYRRTAGLYMIARLVCATAVAQLVVSAFVKHRITVPGEELTGPDLVKFVLLSVVWLTVSYGLLALVRMTATARGLSQTVSEIRLDLLTTAAAVLVVSPLLTTIDGAWKLLVAAPVVAINQIFREQLRREQFLSRDPVTGLLTRQGLTGGVQSITDDETIWQHGPRPFGIVLIDVEPVLTISRTLGRDMYEGVIAAVSRRLVDAYGKDLVARVSSDAIVILIPGLTEQEAETRAEAVIGVLTPALAVDGIPFSVDPVAGVALSPMHGTDIASLLTKAELARTEARRTGRPAKIYAHEATTFTERRLALVRELNSVLQQPQRWHELTMLYQPQIDLDSRRLIGAEALVRWRHPQWGPVPTDELIDAVEPTDVMHLLTRHVLRDVATQMRRWNEEGQPLRVAVNISVQDLHHPAFVAELATLMADQNISSRQLTIEITERMLITDEPRVGRVAEELSQLGVGLSLDDFGTGHASLQQLRQLPLTQVKVDQAYIGGILDNPADRAIITGVHDMARALGVTVVAEGVEDERTANELATLPGIIGQGWHFGAPMPPDELRRHARVGSAWSHRR
jgi:predicted signal transduction protein with EAL and GGDEF domain